MESLGQYKLLQRIAIGGMAEIFLAEKPGPAGFSRKLAIKRILPHRADDIEFVEMFLNEARLVAMLNHPNIVQIYDLGEVDGTYYLAMEYVDGYDLGQILDKSDELNQPIPPAYIARLIAQAASGLHYAHSYNDPQTRQPLHLVHRDISLPNIMVSRDGIVKLLDFGIAKASTTQSQRDPTQAGVLKGKISYMSPEYLRGEKIDGRHDLFALGVVMYELATGQKPFQAKGDVQMLQAILTQPPRDPYAFNPSLPHPLVEIMIRLLAKEPNARIQTGAEIQSALEGFLYQTGQQDITQSHVASYLHGLFGGASRPAHESVGGPSQISSRSSSSGALASRHTPPPARGETGRQNAPVHRPQATSLLPPNQTGDVPAFQAKSGKNFTPNWMIEETRALSLDQLSLASGHLSHAPQLTSALPGIQDLDTTPPTLDAGHTTPSSIATGLPNTPVPGSLAITSPTPALRELVPSEPPPISLPQVSLPSKSTETSSSKRLLLIIVLCFLLGGGAAFGFWYTKQHRAGALQTNTNTPENRDVSPESKRKEPEVRVPQRRPPEQLRPTPSNPPERSLMERPTPVRIEPVATRQPEKQPPSNQGSLPQNPTQPEDRANTVLVKYVKPAGVGTPSSPSPTRTSNGSPRRNVARIREEAVRILPPQPPVRTQESDDNQAVGLHLSSTPRCVVYWRGQMLGLTPRFLPLPPGSHSLMLRRSSPFVRYAVKVRVERGQVLRRHIQIPESLLIVHSPKSAKLYINGNYYGLLTRQRFIRIYAGYHKVVATSAGQTFRRDIHLKGGSRFHLKLNFD